MICKQKKSITSSCTLFHALVISKYKLYLCYNKAEDLTRSRQVAESVSEMEAKDLVKQGVNKCDTSLLVARQNVQRQHAHLTHTTVNKITGPRVNIPSATESPTRAQCVSPVH